MVDINLYREIYDKHKNLKIAATEIGVAWQHLYYHLSKVGHPVTGDKERYGSVTDKMARETELAFKKVVPYAVDENDKKFQSALDYNVKGLKIDIKSSCKKDGCKSNPIKSSSFRWAFSCRVQELISDFLVCYCYEGFDATDHGNVEKILLIPKEFYKNKQSFSVSCTKSKWYDFEVTEKELREFFDSF